MTTLFDAPVRPMDEPWQEESRSRSLATHSHVDDQVRDVAVLLFERLSKALAAGARWTSPVDDEVVLAAMRFAMRYLRVDPDSRALPHISVTDDAGLQLDWHLAGLHLDVEFFPTGDRAFSLASPDEPDLFGDPEHYSSHLRLEFQKAVARL